MSDLQNEMNRKVQGFVVQVTELARRAAIDTLQSAFGDRAPRSGSVSAAAIASTGTRVVRAGRPLGRRGAKRTSADLEALSKWFASFVEAHPGLRIEQINKQLGTTTKALALPIRKLVAEGAVLAKGQKRSTTYFAAQKKAQN